MVQLRIALITAGLTQLQLARACGLSRNQMSDIFRGIRAARPAERLAIARALGKRVRDLFPAAEANAA